MVAVDTSPPIDHVVRLYALADRWRLCLIGRCSEGAAWHAEQVDVARWLAHVIANVIDDSTLLVHKWSYVKSLLPAQAHDPSRCRIHQCTLRITLSHPRTDHHDLRVPHYTTPYNSLRILVCTP